MIISSKNGLRILPLHCAVVGDFDHLCFHQVDISINIIKSDEDVQLYEKGPVKDLIM